MGILSRVSRVSFPRIAAAMIVAALAMGPPSPSKDRDPVEDLAEDSPSKASGRSGRKSTGSASDAALLDMEAQMLRDWDSDPSEEVAVTQAAEPVPEPVPQTLAADPRPTGKDLERAQAAAVAAPVVADEDITGPDGSPYARVNFRISGLGDEQQRITLHTQRDAKEFTFRQFLETAARKLMYADPDLILNKKLSCRRDDFVIPTTGELL